MCVCHCLRTCGVRRTTGDELKGVCEIGSKPGNAHAFQVTVVVVVVVDGCT